MKAPTASLVSLSLLGFLAACSDLATPVDPMSMAGSHAGGQAAHAGNGGNGNPNGGSSAHAGSGSGGTNAHAGSTGKSGNGSGGNGGDAGSAEPSVLALTTVDAHVVGRDGDAVRFTVTGSQSDVGVSAIAVTFEDAQGMPVPMFDDAFDGMLEGTDGRIVFDAPLTADSFTATATLSGIKDTSKLIKAKVSLIDAADAQTDPIDVTIVAQTKLALGDACDAKNVKDRCDAGQSCTGTPTKCVVGVAPTLAEVKYLKAIPGGRDTIILARGTDPDDDMGGFHIELLNAANMPVTIDPDTSPTSTIDVASSKLSTLGSFFGFVEPSNLETAVAKVRVTAIDSLNHQSVPVTASLAAVTQAGDGQTCDPRGFSGCLATSLCVAGLTPTTGKCTKIASAHAAACAAAPKLDPAAGVASVAGRLAGASLWEPPTGCNGMGKTGRPEAAVSLHLATLAKTLTITTKRPETAQDTVLYLIPGCGDSAELDWCNDDEGTYASTLTLPNVAAGDYTIVVESGQVSGGTYGLAVTTE
jgi:hypothetical protein